MALGPDDWISEDQAKRHLNKETIDEAGQAELLDFIQRAEQAIVDRVGYVKQPAAALVEYHQGGGLHLRLNQRPVVEVEEISAAGTVVAPADLDDASSSGYFIKSERGALLQHTSRFPAGMVRVTYKPGWPEIPASLVQATLELLRHMWRTQRGAVGGRAGIRGEPVDQTPPAGMGYALPNRVEQLLHPYVQIPVA